MSPSDRRFASKTSVSYRAGALAHGRRAPTAAILVAAATLLAGCGGGGGAPEPSALGMPLSLPIASSTLPAVDEAPPQNVAVGQPTPAARQAAAPPDPQLVVASPFGMRSQADVDRIEAELLGLAEQQNASAGVVKPRSIIDELKAVGQRHSVEALREIEGKPSR